MVALCNDVDQRSPHIRAPFRLEKDVKPIVGWAQRLIGDGIQMEFAK